MCVRLIVDTKVRSQWLGFGGQRSVIAIVLFKPMGESFYLVIGVRNDYKTSFRLRANSFAHGNR